MKKNTINKYPKLLTFFKKKRYDYIIPIGQGCSGPEILYDTDLRIAAGPFDWTFIKSYLFPLNAIKNKFENYFNKEDLKFTYYETATENDVYLNKLTGIVHLHDFPNHDLHDFNLIYPVVLEQYNRRINRFFDYIYNEKTKKILLLYIERAFDKDYKYDPNIPLAPEITNKYLESNINELNRIYNREVFDILYVKHDETFKMNEWYLDNRILYINNTPINNNRTCTGNIKHLTKLIGLLVGLRPRAKLKTYKYRAMAVILLICIWGEIR